MSPELEILLWAARRAMGAGEDLGPIAKRIKDWKAVVRFASANGMIPLLARSVSQQLAAPLAARRELVKLFLERSGHNKALAEELHEVLGDLSRGGIEALAYKGPALAAMAYGDLSARNPSSDLDLLLRPKDIAQARQIVEARGYRSVLSSTDEVHFLRHRYHLHFERADRNLHLELHWALTPTYWRYPLEVWSRVRRIPVAGAVIATLDPETTLLAVCAHGAKEGWPKLSQVLDVAQLVHTHPHLDWPWVLEEARRMKRQRVLRLGLYLASNRMGAPIPPLVQADLARDRLLAELDAEIGERFGAGYLSGNFRRYAARVWHHPLDRARYFAYGLRILPDRVRSLAQPSEEDSSAAGVPVSWPALQMAVRPFRALGQRGFGHVMAVARRHLWS
ncbi:MAG: nucleotidyltransferase family protein [Bryobacteraceae bacterium]